MRVHKNKIRSLESQHHVPYILFLIERVHNWHHIERVHNWHSLKNKIRPLERVQNWHHVPYVLFHIVIERSSRTDLYDDVVDVTSVVVGAGRS